MRSVVFAIVAVAACGKGAPARTESATSLATPTRSAVAPGDANAPEVPPPQTGSAAGAGQSRTAALALFCEPSKRPEFCGGSFHDEERARWAWLEAHVTNPEVRELMQQVEAVAPPERRRILADLARREGFDRCLPLSNESDTYAAILMTAEAPPGDDDSMARIKPGADLARQPSPTKLGAGATPKAAGPGPGASATREGSGAGPVATRTGSGASPGAAPTSPVEIASAEAPAEVLAKLRGAYARRLASCVKKTNAEVRFEIDANGQATEIEVSPPGLVAECVCEQAPSWRFPITRGADAATRAVTIAIQPRR